MTDTNIRYLLAIYYVYHNESWGNVEFTINNKCPLIYNYQYKFSVLLKNGFLKKKNKIRGSLNKSISYYFNKNKIDFIRLIIKKYSKDRLNNILLEFGVFPVY